MTISSAEARRRALLATAKATLSLSMLGCGSPTTTTPSGGATCDTKLRPTYSDQAIQCCGAVVDEANAIKQAAIEASYRAQATSAAPPVIPPLTPLQLECCVLAVDSVGKGPPGTPPFNYSSLSPACCNDHKVYELSTNWTVCSPWGPPMPPAMPEYLLLS